LTLLIWVGQDISYKYLELLNKFSWNDFDVQFYEFYE